MAPKFKIYDYVNKNGVNEFKGWTNNLQKTQRAKLNEKLDKLKMNGDSLMPQLLSDSDTPGIKKLRIKADNVQLRPLLCNGPVNYELEYTLLMGAIEKDWKLIPQDATDKANRKRLEVVSDPDNRRKEHERVN
ncbi:MAG: hypothetical protein IPN87_18815 [Saprospiraceae bacterium]|nr:hypothetical protein [Candidatus Brachybacter algidus]